MPSRSQQVRAVLAAALVAIVGCTANEDDAAEKDGTSRLALSRPYSASISGGTLRITEHSNDGNPLALRLKAGDATVLEVDVGDDGSADFSFDRSKFDRILVTGGKGDNDIRIDESNGIFTDTVPTTIDGGSGDDMLSGGSGAETFYGGPGNDTIDGNRGNDVVFLGAGDDTFNWDPGDGSDVVEGQKGTDALVFNGSNAAENVDLSADGSRLKFTRNVGNITMDVNGVERVVFNALGGTDNVTVNDLTGTAVAEVDVDLALAGTGDGAADTVTVNGTAAGDTIEVPVESGAVVVNGLAAQVRITHSEAANDQLVIDGLGGVDAITPASAVTSLIQLTIKL